MLVTKCSCCECCRLTLIPHFCPAALLSVNFQSCIFHPLQCCPTFSSPTFSSLALLSVIFQSCIFHPHKFLCPSFSCPANSAPPIPYVWLSKLPIRSISNMRSQQLHVWSKHQSFLYLRAALCVVCIITRTHTGTVHNLSVGL